MRRPMTMRRFLIICLLVWFGGHLVAFIHGVVRLAWMERPPAKEVIVLGAAASLIDVMDEFIEIYEREHPDQEVWTSYDGSSSLASAIEHGREIHVFASADEHTMERVVRAGRVAGEPRPMLTNRLAIAVAPDNPYAIRSLADLERDGLLVGLCAPEVPAGRYARQALAAAEVTVEPSTEMLNVRSLLRMVETGDLDAAIVYRTDARQAADRVTAIEIAPEYEQIARYPIALLQCDCDAREETPHVHGAEFVELVLSSRGREILQHHGFGLP